jgi:hypothetical protein
MIFYIDPFGVGHIARVNSVAYSCPSMEHVYGAIKQELASASGWTEVHIDDSMGRIYAHQIESYVKKNTSDGVVTRIYCFAAARKAASLEQQVDRLSLASPAASPPAAPSA